MSATHRAQAHKEDQMNKDQMDKDHEIELAWLAMARKARGHRGLRRDTRSEALGPRRRQPGARG